MTGNVTRARSQRAPTGKTHFTVDSGLTHLNGPDWSLPLHPKDQVPTEKNQNLRCICGYTGSKNPRSIS